MLTKKAQPDLRPRVRTLAQARAFVRAAGICLVFADRKKDLPNLWDVVDLPEKQPGEKGWGRKIVAECTPLARQIYELVRIEPMTTGALRTAMLRGDKSRRAAFTKALIELQVTLNIVRSNAPEATSDIWVRFSDQYPGQDG
jgi:hypothetical protein